MIFQPYQELWDALRRITTFLEQNTEFLPSFAKDAWDIERNKAETTLARTEGRAPIIVDEDEPT